MSRGKVFGSLRAMVFLVDLARVIFAPLLQPIAADVGVTAASLGLVTSAAWLGSPAPWLAVFSSGRGERRRAHGRRRPPRHRRREGRRLLFYSIAPAMDTYLLSTLPDHHRGSAYAIYSSAMMVVDALGSGVVGSAVTRGVSYGSTFRALAVVVGGIAFGLFVLYRLGRLPSGGTA